MSAFVSSASLESGWRTGFLNGKRNNVRAPLGARRIPGFTTWVLVRDPVTPEKAMRVPRQELRAVRQHLLVDVEPRVMVVVLLDVSAPDPEVGHEPGV